MAGEQVESSSADDIGGDVDSSSPSTYIEILEQGCSIYMVYGMTYEQYWHGDVCMAKYFVEAYEKKKELEFQEQNYYAWLKGMYFMRALEVSSEHVEKSVGAMMSGKKPKKMESEYPKKPFEFEKKVKKELTYEERAKIEIAKWEHMLSR